MSIDDNFSVNTASRGQTKKVTGKVEPVGRLSHEAKKFQREIQDKSVPELRDLLSRQVKILSNEALIKTLPDKGAKVKAKKEQLEELIATRTKALNDAADLLASLSLGPSKKKVDTDKMEWKYGGAHFMKKFSQANPVDSDDDEDDPDEGDSPLKLLASRSEVPDQKKSKELKKCEKARFIPSHSATTALSEEAKATIPLKHTEAAEAKPKVNNPKTDAIPPENMLKEGRFKAKTLDLQESLDLQKEQATRLKQTQLDQAAARLKERLNITTMPVQLTGEQMMAYRTTTAHDDYEENHEEDEEEEVYDEDVATNSAGGGVNYTITEYENN